MNLVREMREPARFFTRCVYSALLLSTGVVNGSAIASPKPNSQMLVAQATSGKAGQSAVQKPVSAAAQAIAPKAAGNAQPVTPFDERVILRDWECITKQPMMELDAKDVFTPDHLSKSEGKLKFTWTDGTTLNLFLETTSRWRIDGDQLCDVPVTMNFTQTSGEPNPYVDQLLAAMQNQADKRIKGNLETCRVIQSLTDKKLILALPTNQGSALTRCSPTKASQHEK